MRVDPSIAGEFDITIPALFIASIFVSADPELPSTMAPAWPIRLPGGAVRPAINPIMGLPFLFFLLLPSFSYPTIHSSLYFPFMSLQQGDRKGKSRKAKSERKEGRERRRKKERKGEKRESIYFYVWNYFYII